jgi:hypothetical protein
MYISKQRYKPTIKPEAHIAIDSIIGDMIVMATLVSKSHENAHSGRTAAILNENNLIQSNILMTTAGHGMSNNFNAITFCMKFTESTKYFTELRTEGDVAVEIITPRATTKPAITPKSIMVSLASGHATHFKFSRKYILQHFPQAQP